MLTERMPWTDGDYKFGQIVGMVGFNGERLKLPIPIPDGCPDFWYPLINSCWIDDPNKRVDFVYISKVFANYYASR